MQVDFRVYLVTDRRIAAGGDLAGTVGKALDGGVRAVQLREKGLSGKELFHLAKRLRAITADFGAILIVNDRADVAKAVGADGVHLGVNSIPPRDARRLLGPDALIGCSTHNIGELRAAEEGGADFVTFGPVYGTPSKAAYGPPLGIDALADACMKSRIPVFAIGGVGVNNARETAKAGSFGIALISGIMAAANPKEAARELAETIDFATGPPPKRKGMV
jgi:thiamine-phosphate pyrophosphorylase